MKTIQPDEIIFYKFTNDILKHVYKNVKCSMACFFE